MDQEQRPQLEGFAVAHELAASEDDGIVDDNEDARLLDRGHGGHASLEPEVFGGEANHLLKGLVEERP